MLFLEQEQLVEIHISVETNETGLSLEEGEVELRQWVVNVWAAAVVELVESFQYQEMSILQS